MARRPRDIGTAAETAVVRYLAANGFPHAERRSLKGALDCGDITGTPGLCWEVKGGQAAKVASDAQVQNWLVETEQERQNADSDFGVLVLQRAGIGLRNAGRWWVVLPACSAAYLFGRPHTLRRTYPVRLHLADAVALLRAAGYGTPLPQEATV